ncbi:MAG: leucyl aminopeptidase [Steroidobacteraceae bacterium]
MKFEVWNGDASRLRADSLVAGVFEGGELPDETRQIDKAAGGRIAALARRGDFAARSGDTLLLTDLPGLRASRVLLVGQGKRADLGRKPWRRAVHAAVVALAKTRIASAAFALARPVASELDDYWLARATAEITAAALYRVNDLKSGRKPRAAALARLLVGPVAASGTAAAKRGLGHGAAVGVGLGTLRDLANLPSNVCTPSYLAGAARKLAQRHPKTLRVRVLDERAIRRERMGCFLAVTRGSDEPPRFIVLEHRGGKAGSAPVVLVGKGITFDTGGISLKDPPAMDEMKFDMSGAATVIAALTVVSELALPLNVVGLVPTCENMPGGRATKPGDIVTSASGQTVEILNTDAEGRLILSDALHYARRFKPAAVIDIATLTGACVVALGAHHSGVMANDDALAQELVDCGRRADDRAWQLPLTEDYAEQLKSNFADMANVAGRDGGAITAGAFLGKFTKGLKWAHMDIAGTAYLSGAQKGSTGRPISLLSEFLIRRAAH